MGEINNKQNIKVNFRVFKMACSTETNKGCRRTG